MKKLNELELLTLRLLLDEMINDCPECGTERKEIEFKELPAEAKKEFKEFKEIARFLHCVKCESYSMIIDD